MSHGPVHSHWAADPIWDDTQAEVARHHPGEAEWWITDTVTLGNEELLTNDSLEG